MSSPSFQAVKRQALFVSALLLLVLLFVALFSGTAHGIASYRSVELHALHSRRCPGLESLFEPAEVALAIKQRQAWLAGWQSTLQLWKSRADVFNQEGWDRFNNFGPTGPRCKKMLAFGSGDDEKRACEFSTGEGW